MRARRALIVAAGVAVSLSFLPRVEAATGSLTVGSVGGRQVKNGRVAGALSGPVTVTGSASTDAHPGPAPLVADAGDSAFVTAGQPATLLGQGFGGTAPHTFSWTTEAGTITEGADGPSAVIDTTGLAPGSFTATLRVTDATGQSAADSVVVVVADVASATLLDESEAGPTVGLSAVGATAPMVFPFTVPAGTQSLDATASWSIPTNDFDLALIDPAGNEDLVGDSPPGDSETTHADAPAPGAWRVEIRPYATIPDTVHVVVDSVGTTPDPRPVVDAGGPYRFALDAPQHLDGTVTSEAPVSAAWDLDGDGIFETAGTDVDTDLAEGRHLVTLKATDTNGLERREAVSVLVADPARIAAETVGFTVIGIADTGINPYHLEFSAATYPDPDVLALTSNFTRHPSEYIPGYPADTQALPVTLGQGYWPEADADLWQPYDEQTNPGGIKGQTLYWIPGTKIIGAIDADASTGLNAAEDPHPILDDDGHGTGSEAVATGNRYGYCGTCLLVIVEGLEEGIATTYPWVDVTSHSFGYTGGAPLGLVTQPNPNTKAAVERGQTVLFAAGNGMGNAFDVPIATYGSDQTGPDWNITVGAVRRDSQRAIVGDGIPVHISAWGDGDLPAACRTGTTGQCAHGGTSAATPYTAGVFGTVLTGVRDAIGDGTVGQRVVGAQGQVVASGFPVAGSEYLQDGILTRAELRDAVLRTATALPGEPSAFPFPVTAPYNEDTNVLFEGYGAATPESAQRAIDVLLGREPVPDRPAEDDFFAIDRSIRDTLYGGYDRDGDGDEDFEGLPEGLAGLGLDGLTDVDLEGLLATVQGTLGVIDEAAALLEAAPAPSDAPGEQWFLHRTFAGEPGATAACDHESNELTMDHLDSIGDIEPCFESRITSIPAAYRPLGIWASTGTLDAPLPAGSTVSVDLYLTTEVPAAVRPTGVLVATDREIGTGAAQFQVSTGSGPGAGSDVGAIVASVALPDLGGCAALAEACWTRYQWSFTTSRPAFAGEQLTFQVQLIGTRAWSFGYEGAHASSITIAPAPVPEVGFGFGASIVSPSEGEQVQEGDTVVAGGTATFPDQGTDPTGAGDHPEARHVQVAVDDPGFAAPMAASYDESTGQWSAPIRGLGPGEHTVFARARVGDRVSEVESVTFTVRPATRVEWQVTDRNVQPDPAAWHAADGVDSWSFTFDAAAYGTGSRLLVTRLVDRGVVLAQQSVRIVLQ